MRVCLLFPDRDLALDALPEPDPDLVVDLELERLFAAMARGDGQISAVARRVVVSGAVPSAAGHELRAKDASQRVADVAFRQAAVADALASPETVRTVYRLATDAVAAERRVWGGALRNAELVLRRSVEVLDGLLGSVAEIRDVLVRARPSLQSAAMLGLADRLATDVDDALLERARSVLRRVSEEHLVATGTLGPGNRPAGFVLRAGTGGPRRLRDRVGFGGHRGYAVDVALHDQNAMNALAELRARAVADAAAAVNESAACLLAFCRTLRDETAFLVGCVNLDTALAGRGVARSTPDCSAGEGSGLLAQGIIDPCLALSTDTQLVRNDVDTAGWPLTVVTGANGGGKSTLLRAVGVARLMAAAGMPVAAEAFRAPLPDGIVAHFPRPEQEGDGSGRLDAELRRLDRLVGRTRPRTLVLLNEPLSTVNERDGSAIGGDVVRGLVQGGAEVWLVTHHHELGAALHATPPAPTRVLRAERGEGAGRPFRFVEAPPLATSFGVDLWADEVGTRGDVD